jgi:release factor glutamine methyltransferase
MTLKDLSNKFILNLNAIYNEDEAQAIYLIALEHVLKYRRTDYLLNKTEVISTEKLNKLEAILTALQTGKPIQYITGETIFYGLPFKVNSSVLIPRPETEELVDWIISTSNSLLQTPNSQPSTILDIGTGSGCIAISLKKNLPDAKVFAIDIAKDSLTTAENNAILNEVEVEFIEQDILQTPNSKIPTQYSIIVSNPPYVTENEKSSIHKNVIANEPHRALFVSNDNPLIFYDAIADFALKNLTSDGLLFFEINEYLGKQTVDLLKYKRFKNIELRKDMQGKDRMICCSI